MLNVRCPNFPNAVFTNAEQQGHRLVGLIQMCSMFGNHVRFVGAIILGAVLAFNPPISQAQPSGLAVDDAELEAISPTTGAVTVGEAGDDPADIARYLLASGAGAARISPDGSRIALRHSVTGKPQLWVLPVHGGQMQQLTFGNGVTFFRWSGDSDYLLYGADNDGDEQESYILVRADGSDERRVLPPVAGGFRRFGDFSADGRAIYFASTERNGLDFDIYRAELSTGASTLLYAGNYGMFARSLSPDGRYLIIDETVGEDGDNLHLLDTQTLEMAVLSAPAVRASHTQGGFVWLPDSSGFYLASNLDSEFAALMHYGLDAGRFQTVVQSEYDIGDVHLCGVDDRYLVWTVSRDGFETVHYRNLNGGAVQAIPGLPEGNHSLACARDRDLMTVLTNGWRTPGDVHLWNFGSQQLQLSFASNLAGLDPERLVRPQSVRMAARDGVMLQGLLYLPDAESRQGDGPPPVIFEVHGGPTGQSRPTFDPVVQYHLDRGIAVFEPNVRGSAGFGRTYTTLDDRSNRLDSVRDLVDMLDFFRRDGRVDVDRAVVSGGSYGGYMVNAVLAAYPDSFQAGVARYGVGDWVTALEVASPALKASDRIEFGDINLPEWRSFYEVNSPIAQAHRIKVPVLYSHGAMDPRIDIAESETMVRVLRENGIDAPFIRIPDEGHGWRKLSNRLFYYREQAEFIEAVLAADGEVD